MEPKDIAPDIAVFHRANPGRIGILTGGRLDAMFVMAEVDWGSQLEFVDVSQLVVRDKGVRPSMDGDVRSGRYGTVDDLRRRVTFEKLRGMLTDVFYSMKTSEIDFYPHQFKPVLRFIDSATNRLLIADEVGLGKTIEAGLIWTEWQAREKARRLLVVCTSTLVPKWLRELQERFQLAAEAADARRLLDLLEQFDSRGPGLSFALVTSYQALRPFRAERPQLQRLRDGVDEDSRAQVTNLAPRVRLLSRVREQGAEAIQTSDAPFIDMVVFDEAHYMKNTGSASYLAGEILSSAAGAAVCLSATPIHNKSRDLYALLRLIDPEVFRDEFVFDLLRRQNLPVVQLQNALSATTWEPEEIQPLIDRLHSVEARESLREAMRISGNSPRGRVESRHSVERMNLLGNFINRTRKRDVMENRVMRQPVTRAVSMTDEESAFYSAVLALVRNEVRRRGDVVTSFHLIHPALRMSSSLPVIAAAVREGKWGGFEEIEQLAEDYADMFDLESVNELPTPDEFRKLCAYDFERNDSKYAELRNALHLINANGGIRSDTETQAVISPKDKIIIFAFFKDTIAYLKRRLAADGIPALAVTGDIKDRKERDRLFQQFAADESRILLCSEIGAEGVDLQFARVVINYDLPWNPMRVEQRIGRIDRIGQKAPSVVIINFRIEDTIDGSVYKHLYQKIGVFEQSIGALEGILGEEVAKLTAQIFREDLTMEQVAERAEQTADAVCQRAKTEAELENSAGALIAFQDLLSEQIGDSQRLGRFIKPAELRLHVEDFFAGHYKGADACLLVPDNPAPGCLELKLSFRALSDFESYCLQSDDFLIFQLGVPTGLLSDGGKTERLFREAFIAGYDLRREVDAKMATARLHSTWSKGVDKALNGDNGALDERFEWQCLLYPEVAAAVQTVFRSPNARDGLYITMDVGAGTVDLNAFRRFSGHPGDRQARRIAQLDYYSAIVCPLGVQNLRDPHGAVELRSKDQMRQELRQSLKTLYGRAIRYQPNNGDIPGRRTWDEATLFIFGGGARYSGYRNNFVAGLEEAGINYPQAHNLPEANDFLCPRGVEFGRFAVAYGLSFFRPSLNTVSLPHELETFAQLYPEIANRPPKPYGFNWDD